MSPDLLDPLGSLGGAGAQSTSPTLKISRGAPGGGGPGGLAGAVGGALGGAAGGIAGDLLASLGAPTPPDPLTASVVSVDVRLAAAPMLATCRLGLLPQADFPDLEPGDALTIELGYGDATTPVFAGPISSIGMRRGALQILLGAPATPLARMRRNSGYESQSFGDLAKLWAGEAGLQAGDIDAGPDYAFLAIDDRHSLWDWLARLARHAGVPVWIDADGKLHARAPRGQPVATWTWGEDIVALDAIARDPATTAARMVGEGSAGRQGSDAWAWLAKDPQGVSATGAPGGAPGAPAGAGGGLGAAAAGAAGSLVQDGALRDLAGIAGAAQAQAAAAAKLTDVVRVIVPGTPTLDVAGKFKLAGCPSGYGDGEWTAVEVRHRFDVGRGFTTDATGVAP